MKATVEGEGKSPEEMDTAVHQLVSRAVASEEVVDIFAAAGLKKPDISILSDDFLREVRQLPHRNRAIEAAQVIEERILRKYGYPPDKREKATQTVLEQAEVLCKEWTL